MAKYAKSRTQRGMGETKTFWIGALTAAVLVGIWLPTNYVHRSLEPHADPKYIRRVYAEHTIGQTFHTKFETDILRVLLRTKSSGPKTLHASVAGQQLTVTSTLTDQDLWVDIPLMHPLPRGEYDLVLSAPEITAQDEAILVRFQIASTDFEPGYMVVDSQASYGDIAFQIVDRIPAWQQVVRYFVTHPNHASHVARTLALAAAAALVVALLPRTQQAWRISLLVLFVLTVLIRIPTLASIDGVFGGDAFNYLSKAKAWISGDDPFNADPRKGPFFPFLLIPVFLTNDLILWSRFVGALTAGIAAAAVAFTLKRLGLSAALSLLGGALVAVNREFWWESLNGLANVPYAALIALTTLSYTINAPYATSLFAALTALTRYEGILVGAVYIPLLWIRNRFRIHTLRLLLVPLILLALPFVFWPITGQLGIRTASDITNDSGLYIAWDWGDYLSNFERFKAYIQELWFYRYEPPLRYFTWAVYGLAAAGAIALLRRRPSLGLSIILVAGLQIAVITAILPKTRYYVQIIPLLAVLLFYGINVLPRRTRLIAASLLVASVAVNAHNHLPEFIEDYNSRAHSDSVLIQASVFFKKIESRPAFAINFLPPEVYLPRAQVVMGAPESADAQLAWLRENCATHLMETTKHVWFQDLLEQYPQHFEYVTAFKASYDPAQATIYQIVGL